MKKKLYGVWFRQINSQKYEVRARNPEEAQRKAEKIWTMENKIQLAEYIAELNEDGTEK